MSRAVSLRIHDALLKVALHFSGKRFRDVTNGQKAVSIQTRAHNFQRVQAFFRDPELDPEILVLVFKLINDGLESGRFVLVPRSHRSERNEIFSLLFAVSNP